MAQLDRTWPEEFGQIESMTTVSKTNNVMVFFIKNYFIVGVNDPPCQVVMWVDCRIQLKTNSEMINNGNKSTQRNINILCTLEIEIKNHRSFNGKDAKREDFMSLDLPWFFLHDLWFSTDAENDDEPCILSCHHKHQTGHYYHLEAAVEKATIFCFLAKRK